MPSLVNGIDSVKVISVRDDQACAVMDNDSAMCQGGNAYGQLGIGNTDNKPLPVLVSDLDGDNITSISSEEKHSCALLSNRLI